MTNIVLNTVTYGEAEEILVQICFNMFDAISADCLKNFNQNDVLNANKFDV